MDSGMVTVTVSSSLDLTFFLALLVFGTWSSSCLCHCSWLVWLNILLAGWLAERMIKPTLSSLLCPSKDRLLSIMFHPDGEILMVKYSHC